MLGQIPLQDLKVNEIKRMGSTLLDFQGSIKRLLGSICHNFFRKISI